MITKAWVEKSEHMPYLSSLHINDDYGNEYSIELRPKTGDYLLIIEALQHCVQSDDAYCACQPSAVLYPHIAQDCPKCGKPHRR